MNRVFRIEPSSVNNSDCSGQGSRQGSAVTEEMELAAVSASVERKVGLFEVLLAVLVMLAVCIFGSAEAQPANCNGSAAVNANLSYNPLGPSTQISDIYISWNYNCNGAKAGRFYTNVNDWPDISVATESLQVARGEVYNFPVQSINRPANLPGSGNWTNVGFVNDWSAGANLNTIRVSMTNAGIVNPGTRFLPVNLVIPNTSNYWSYSYSCGSLFRPRTCRNSGYDLTYYDSPRSLPIVIASAMALSLSGGGSTGTMDFGNNLATAAKQSVNLRFRSNTPYRVTMNSTHNGVLKLNNSAAATDQIAYSATLNGTSITEGAPFINTSPTGTGGADVTLPFEVTIGDTSNARAGFYKDVVTVTVSANP